MKKYLISFSLMLLGAAAGAQTFYQDVKNPDMLRRTEHREIHRREIILPQVNGYNVYKADLHTHSAFSDGSVLPKFRVKEAWYDGLDVMAVTEHIEYRPVEEMLVDYLEKYRSKKCDKAVNNSLVKTVATKEGIMVDLNFSVRQAQKEAERYGIVIIPGSEITRDGVKIGHFNALFTVDNNTIYDPDPVQSIRNAKAQGALVMHNHPGWTRTGIDFTEAEAVAYGEGLIDGVEVVNSAEFYPGIIDRVHERGLFIAANSDVHGSTAVGYGMFGELRPMTLILAKDCSLESIREALVECRTIAYGCGALCGDEQLLKDFFIAGVTLKVISVKSTGKAKLMLTNNTSVPYLIRREGYNPKWLDPFTTAQFNVTADDATISLSVLNMFCSENSHPVVELPLR